MATTKKRKPARRSVRPVPLTKEGVAWTHFERIDSRRMRLKPEFSRTYFALCHLLADEFDVQRVTMTQAGPELSESQFGYAGFLKHASAALRMAAERSLKSFTLSDVSTSERYTLEQWQSAVNRLSRKGELPSRDGSIPDSASASS